jgi:hypothetical protein
VPPSAAAAAPTDTASVGSIAGSSSNLPRSDIYPTFADGARAVRFVEAVLFGSIIGRVLPALIAASMVFLVLIAFGLGARWALVSSQAVIVDQKHWSSNDGSIMLEQLVRYPSGEIGSANGMWWGYDDQGNLTGQLAGSTMLMWEVPGSAYPLVAGVESGAMLVIAGGFLAASGLVIRRRRPY